ncbi:hypothetical protein [Thermococcus gammatolerans]|nr:hypothetical protein [Thermococcus gammatolerans]
MKMRVIVERDVDRTVKEILPWATSDYLEKAMEEKKREMDEVLEILDSLSLSEVPEEIRDIVKRPRWETLLAD